MRNLRYLRKNRNLSMKALGDIFGLAESTISLYETGKREPDNTTMLKIADYFGVSVDYLLGREPIEDEVEINDNYPVPIVGRVIAGMPIESEEHIEGYIYINYKPKEDYFALRVHGDSMINAGIREGSILVVRKQSCAESGDIVVALLNGEQTVKRFKVYSNTPFLMPENPAYDPIPIPEGSDLVILGKVVEVRFAF